LAPQERRTAKGNSLRQPNLWHPDETDWPSLSSWLNLSQERVAKGERLVARQKELVAEVANRGADVSRYESLLAILEEAQRLHLAHRDRLVRRLEERTSAPKLDRQTSYDAEAMIRTIREPLVVVDEELRVVTASESFYRFFGAAPADTLGRLLPDTDAHRLDTPAMRAFLVRVKAGDRTSVSYEIEVDAAALGRRVLAVTAEPIHDVDATDKKILISFFDVTEFKRAAEQLAAAKQAAEQANLDNARTVDLGSRERSIPRSA